MDYEERDLERKRRELFEQSGVEPRHKKDFAVLATHKEWEQVYRKTLEIVKGGGIVILLGDRGTGKTQLAAMVIKEMCRDFRSCKMYRTREVNNILLDMQSENKRSQGIDLFVKPFLLVLDELQEKFDTDFASRSLSLIIDKRYGWEKSAILIANLSEGPCRDLLGASIVDRVKECGGLIKFTWKSFRRGQQPEGKA